MTDEHEKTCMGLLGGAKKRKVAQNSLDNLRLWHGRKSVDLEEGNAAASCTPPLICTVQGDRSHEVAAAGADPADERVMQPSAQASTHCEPKQGLR